MKDSLFEVRAEDARVESMSRAEVSEGIKKLAETVKDKKEAREKAKVDFNSAGQLQAKIDVIAEFLGLKDSVGVKK